MTEDHWCEECEEFKTAFTKWVEHQQETQAIVHSLVVVADVTLIESADSMDRCVMAYGTPDLTRAGIIGLLVMGQDIYRFPREE